MVVQFYQGPWGSIYKDPQFTQDATARTVRRKARPPQWGDIGESSYVSQDGGPRLQRSIIPVRSCHGTAMHPTQKPVDIVSPYIKYSSREGDVLLDPSMGSGTTLVTAKKLNRYAIGIELSQEDCQTAVQRLAQGFFDFA